MKAVVKNNRIRHCDERSEEAISLLEEDCFIEVKCSIASSKKYIYGVRTNVCPQ